MLAAMLLAGSAHAAQLLIDFEDGFNEVFTDRTEQGVQFHVDDGFATYGAGSYDPLGGFLLLQGQALELDKGATLTIDLTAFQTLSQLALDVFLPGGPALVDPVQLFDANGGQLIWDEPALNDGAELHYAYFGSDARLITIHLEDPFDPSSPLLAIDNLTASFGSAPPVPEPSSYVLAGVGLLVLGSVLLPARRRRQAAS
jgi:hypothetical protein